MHYIAAIRFANAIFRPSERSSVQNLSLRLYITLLKKTGFLKTGFFYFFYVKMII